jgi:hypothetical protein
MNPCEGCAFTEGAAANLEPDNALRGRLAVLGAIPFYCHEGVDWQNPESHKRTNCEIRDQNVCAGWKREVGELAKTGWYKRDGKMAKGFAIAGLGALEIFLNSDDESDDKADANDVLQRVCATLGRRLEDYAEAK